MPIALRSGERAAAAAGLARHAAAALPRGSGPLTERDVQQQEIYLDYNATTPVDPRVAEAMMLHLRGGFGNPSSAHSSGRRARQAVERARQQTARLIRCEPDEIIFTSGGSESNNTALKGLASARRNLGNHIISSQIEHPSVISSLRYLERIGVAVTFLPVDSLGRVSPADVERAVTPATTVISVMHANNEVGTIEPITDIARIAHSRNILLHVDASQSVGRIPVDVRALDVDALTFSGHKIYAPKGIGGLYLRRGIMIEPLVHGSGHELGRRAGTENVPGIVALGAACDIAAAELPEAPRRLAALRTRLERGLRQVLGRRLRRNGDADNCLPGTLNISIDGLSGSQVLDALPEVAASTGSACHAGSTDPSPVLLAMGAPYDVAAGAVRLSLGRWTTAEEIDRVIELFRARLGATGGTSS